MVGVNRGMPSGTQCDELMSVNKIILISRLETETMFSFFCHRTSMVSPVPLLVRATVFVDDRPDKQVSMLVKRSAGLLHKSTTKK